MSAKIKINVWLTDPARWATNEADVAESAAAEFNRMHPEYLVEIDPHDFRTMPAEVAAAVQQGNPPDIAEYHHTVTRAAAELLDGWYAENPDLRVGRDQLEAADGSPAALGPLLGGHAGIVGELTDAMHDVLTAGTDPADRFAEANDAPRRSSTPTTPTATGRPAVAPVTSPSASDRRNPARPVKGGSSP